MARPGLSASGQAMSWACALPEDQEKGRTEARC